MPPYKKPNNGQEEPCRNKWGGERRNHPAKSGNLRSDANYPHHRVHQKMDPPVHLAPPLQAVEPNVGDHLEGNVEERMYVYIFMTIRNTVIDQGVAIWKKTIAPGKCVNAGQRPRDKHRTVGR